ncbi:hypothetical protein [Novosphingobium sp. B-7]|uniref:hypothetical protein n=1 Tax=Novosphingobium sp. B-7 TaxID=1298855 RepID=UPI0003B593A2|nr:hypothetical protein [Novosphingobium sp. B-7]
MSDARARERLRQERIASEQVVTQCAQWFQLKLRFGYVALFVFVGIAALAASVVLLAHFSATSIAVAALMILGNLLSLAIFVMKVVLQPNDALILRPITSDPAMQSHTPPQRAPSPTSVVRVTGRNPSLDA